MMEHSVCIGLEVWRCLVFGMRLSFVFEKNNECK
jgi:hypothetical protein